jgi:steroid 5-alpha reductase family enzyme
MALVDPLIVNLCILLAVCVVTWLLSVATGEHSWVDRIWSVAPVCYVWVYAAATGMRDVRLVVLACLVTLWGARLTFNFARKGGYARGGEDYRWAVLRSRMGRRAFALFNLFFIVIYQNLLLWLITLPAWTAYRNPTPVNALDLLAALLFLGLLAGETTADQQQWNFHRRKSERASAGLPVDPPFLTTGLFRYSRHPNFFFEQAQWWVVFLFGAIAAGSVLQWTVVGAVLLSVLFVGSTVFTESISGAKYPQYADYQARTSAIVPWPPRRSGRTAG